METNKETRMISSDEILYAVLKDGTVVSNFREVAESKEWTDKIPLLLKELFNSRSEPPQRNKKLSSAYMRTSLRAITACL